MSLLRWGLSIRTSFARLKSRRAKLTITKLRCERIPRMEAVQNAIILLGLNSNQLRRSRAYDNKANIMAGA